MHDIHQTIQATKDRIIEAVNKIGPVEANGKTLTLKNVVFEDLSKADPFDYAAHKTAKLNNKTFGVGIHADAVVVENGQETTHRVKIGNMPILTADASYIVGGSSYTVDHQFRLKPGAYLRQKANGEIETHLNPDGFPNARATIDPKNLKLTFGIGQADVNALAFMTALGMSNAEQQELLGAEIHSANSAKLNLSKEYAKLASYLSTPKNAVSVEQVPAALKLKLEGAKLDPRVTQITLGKPLADLGKATIKAVLKKTIAGSRGEAEFDERDSLAFKNIHSVQDFVHDRIAGKMAINSMRFDLKNLLYKDKPITEVVNSALLDSKVHPLFTSSSISEFAPRDNPLQMIGAARKITSTGEGGLENAHAITPDTQAVHPSQAFFVDPLDTPESQKAGIALKLSLGVHEIKDGQPFVRFRNAKSGKVESRSPIDSFNEHILLPGEPMPDGKVAAIHRGKQVQVKPSQITLEPLHVQHAFAESSLIAPTLNSNQANRAGMRARHAAQSASLVHREAPLVQSINPVDGGTWEHTVGLNTSPIVAPHDLKIVKVTDSHIHAEFPDGTEKSIVYRNNHLGTNKAYFAHEVQHLVPGTIIKKGEIVADTNFTKGGTLALGRNMHVAYMPWHGLNFEDGIVISQDAATKLTSSHMSTHDFDIHTGETVMGKKQFLAAYPTKYTKAQLAKLDENGMPIQGAVFNPGDPIYLKLQKAQLSKEDVTLGKLHKTLMKPFKDHSETWTGIHPATVIDSVLNKTFAKVNLKYEAPAQVGDKMANRHGAKGVISAIVPTNEMPHNKAGEPVEVILSPLSIITRMSMGQVLETAASKIAKKTGTPYLIESFDPKTDYVDKIQKDLKTHGLEDREELTDPKTGHSYGKVLTGFPVMQKLFKLAHGNMSSRDLGSYDSDHKPMSGGDNGSKSIDALTLYGLMAHGHRNILNEVSTIKGDYNPDWWQKLQMGMPLPKPDVPFAYKKFEGLLAASGINVRQDGSMKILAPMTDADTRKASGNNVIKNVNMLDHKLEPISGGLFDIAITGGSRGNKWSRMELPHAIPNPMFESAIKSITGIDDKTFKGLLNHTHEIGGVTGPEAFSTLLKGVSVHKDIEATKLNLAATKSQSGKDKLLKKLKLLKALDSLKLTAHEAYMMKDVPVLPPAFRPVIELPNGSVSKSSLNVLYRDTGLIAEAMQKHGLSGNLYKELYQSVGAIQGVNDPVSPQALAQKMKGAVEIISGSTPKTGFFQNKVIRKQQDLSARATIALDTNLSMDEISIPEDIAHSVYKPFATRTLVNQGYSVVDAHKHIDDKTHIGKVAIEHEMSTRPILMNRAPSLHRFSIMAFRPKINQTESVLIPGLITKPFGADFDGDTVMLHVPATEAAKHEAFQMLPSKNLHNAKEKDLNFTPDQEASMGLHMMTRTPEGRAHFNKMLPSGIPHITEQAGKNAVNKVLEMIAVKHPSKYGEIASLLKETGDKFATMAGYSVGLSDMKAVNYKAGKDLFVRAYMQGGSIADLLKADAAVTALSKTDPGNNFVKSHIANARGNANNIKQILYAPGMLLDHNGELLARPIMTGYGQGLGFADYWTTTYSARKGTLDKQLSTSEPGALNKEIVNSAINLVISEEDCGTKHGLSMSANDPHVVGRFEAGTNRYIDRSYAKGKSTIVVRSPQTCESVHGVCKKCFGHTEFGAMASIGHNVGVVSAQAASEPLTQAAMKTFHTGGTASGSGGAFGGFKTIANFLQAPSTFKDKATLATVHGTVDSIKKGAAGGWHIGIDGEDHFVNPLSGDLIVKKGDKANKGDLLNVGIPHPVEAIDLLGAHKGGQLVVDSLHNLYKASGIGIDRKNLETVVRALSGFAKVTDPGTHKGLVQNDIVNLSTVRAFNEQANKPFYVKPEDSHGMILSKAVVGISAGTELTSDHMHHLSKHETIEVIHKPIEFNRVFIGSSQAPTKTGDWLGNLSFRYLKRGLEHGAMFGSKSDTHGYNPLAAFVTGTLKSGDSKGRY